jgi:hypothetical protein
VLRALFAAFVVGALAVGIPSVRHAARAEAIAWRDTHPGLIEPKGSPRAAPETPHRHRHRHRVTPKRPWSERVNAQCRREKQQIEALGHAVTYRQVILRFRALLVLDARYLKRFRNSHPPARYRKQAAAYVETWLRGRAAVRQAILDLQANDVDAYFRHVAGYVETGARAENLAKEMGLPDCVTPAVSK